MLQKNALTEVPPDSPGFYSNVFLVRKASGGWRPVIDLKRLNTHIYSPHFRISSVLSSVRKGDYAFKIDMQDAYFHIAILPSSRKYLRFAFKNKVYHFRVLPLGMNTASGIYSLGAYRDRVPPSSGDFSYSFPGRLVSLPSRPSSVTSPSVSASKHAKTGGKTTLPSTGYPVLRDSVMPGSGESPSPRLG